MKGFRTTQEIHAKIPLIDLTTVYRNLEKLCESGYIQKILLPHQEYAYEYTKNKHHHIFCEGCKKIKHVHLSQKTLSLIPELSHLKADSIEIIIKGNCK